METAVRAMPVANEEEPGFALLRHVGEISTVVVKKQLAFPELHDSITQLEKLIFSLDGDPRATAVCDCLSPETVASINDGYCGWESRLECEFIDRLLKGEAALADYPLYERSQRLVERELRLVSGIHPQRILFIGSGALPLSAIHAFLQTGLPVDCVGRDSDVVACSRTVLERCGFANSVSVVGALSDCMMSGYGLVVMELPAKRKKAILKSLRKRCCPGCQVLCRTTLGLRRLLHQGIQESELRGFHFRGRQIAEGTQTVSTWLLEAAGSAATSVRLVWLRSIDAERASQILRLMNRTLAEETTIGFPGPIDEESGHALMRQLDADISAGRRHVLVAEKEGVIVGQLILTPNSTPNHRHIVELTRGTIDPSFRGGGLALRAFQEVAKKCDELGREVICLDVRAGTLAAIWWQYFGFKRYGLLQDYSRVGNKRYKGLFLAQSTAELKERIRQILRLRVPYPGKAMARMKF